MSLRQGKRRERYSRNLEGWNAEGYFSPASPSAYATETTPSALLRAGAEGTIGIYDASDDTLVTGAAPATWRVIQKQDGQLKASSVFTTAGISASKTVYDAPVVQEAAIGYNGTGGNLNINIVGGLQEFVARATETTPANQPYPIQEGRAQVRSGTPSEYDVVSVIVGDLVSKRDFENNADENFVRVDIISSVAGTANVVAATYSFLEGSAVVTAGADVTAEAVPGDFLIVDSGIASGPSVFKVLSSDFDSGVATIVLDQAWPFESVNLAETALANTDKATLDAGTLGIRFRGFDELTVFEVNASEDLADATITQNVAWKQGSGAAFQVASIEDETTVFDGWTTLNAAFVRDYGAPTLFVDENSDDQYDLYFVTYIRNVESVAPPMGTTTHYGNLVIGAISGSDLASNLDTIFGL